MRINAIIHFILIMPTLVLIGCQNSTIRSELINDLPETILVNPSTEKILLDYSSVIKNRKYIKLETNPNCIIGGIDKIQIYDHNIFILDNNIAKSLFIFTDEGNFKTKISNIGRGPGEFTIPRDFWLDTLNQEVIILDHMSKKKLRYNYDGVLTNEITLDFNNSGTFAFISPDSYAYDIDNAYNINYSTDLSKKLLITDNKNNIIGTYLSSKKWQDKFINAPFKFCTSPEGVYYIPKLVDTIYNITKDGIKSRYFVDFGSKKLDISKFSGSLPDKELIKNIFASDYAFNIVTLVENNDYLFFSFLYRIYDSQPNFVFYSKHDKKVLYFTKLSDSGKTLGLFYPKAAYKDEFVFVLEPYVLFEEIDKYKTKNAIKYQEALNEFGTLLSSTTNKDNPILVFCKLKF